MNSFNSPMDWDRTARAHLRENGSARERLRRCLTGGRLHRLGRRRRRIHLVDGERGGDDGGGSGIRAESGNRKRHAGGRERCGGSRRGSRLRGRGRCWKCPRDGRRQRVGAVRLAHKTAVRRGPHGGDNSGGEERDRGARHDVRSARAGGGCTSLDDALGLGDGATIHTVVLEAVFFPLAFRVFDMAYGAGEGVAIVVGLTLGQIPAQI